MGAPDKIPDEERVIIESYPWNTTSPLFPIKMNGPLELVAVACITLLKIKVVVLTYGGNLFVEGQEKG